MLATRWTLYNKLEARHRTCSPFIIPMHLPTTVHTVDDKRASPEEWPPRSDQGRNEADR